jgi:hypothetical protein
LLLRFFWFSDDCKRSPEPGISLIVGAGAVDFPQRLDMKSVGSHEIARWTPIITGGNVTVE